MKAQNCDERLALGAEAGYADIAGAPVMHSARPPDAEMPTPDGGR